MESGSGIRFRRAVGVRESSFVAESEELAANLCHEPVLGDCGSELIDLGRIVHSQLIANVIKSSKRGLNVRKNAAQLIDRQDFAKFTLPMAETLKMAQVMTRQLSQSAATSPTKTNNVNKESPSSSSSAVANTRKLTRVNTLSAHKPSWLRVTLRPGSNGHNNEEQNLNFASELLSKWSLNQEATCPFVIGTQDFEMFRTFVRGVKG